MWMCCACGAPSSRPLTSTFTSAEFPVTVTHAVPLPVTWFATIGSSVAWYDIESAAEAEAGVSSAMPRTQADAPTTASNFFLMPIPFAPRHAAIPPRHSRVTVGGDGKSGQQLFGCEHGSDCHRLNVAC